MDHPNKKIPKTEGKCKKKVNLLNQPALRNIVDLALDSHEKGFLGIGAIVLLQVILRNFTKLNRWRERMDLLQVPSVGSVIGGRSEETGNEIVNGKSKSQHSEEGGRREACVGHDRLLQRLPDLQSHGGWGGKRERERERD